MAIIKSITTDVFDVSAVKKNDFIRARHKSWAKDDVVNGLVASVSEKEIIVAYLPEVRNVRSHFFIPVTEVVDGQWSIIISKDLTESEEFKITGDTNES